MTSAVRRAETNSQDASSDAAAAALTAAVAANVRAQRNGVEAIAVLMRLVLNGCLGDQGAVAAATLLAHAPLLDQTYQDAVLGFVRCAVDASLVHSPESAVPPSLIKVLRCNRAACGSLDWPQV